MLQVQDHHVFKAFSEPIRLRIAVLLTQGELCVCDLTEVLQLPQSTVSRHMNRLKVSGIVLDRRDGKWVHYSLAGEFSRSYSEYQSLLETLQQKEPYQSDRRKLVEYLKTKKC